MKQIRNKILKLSIKRQVPLHIQEPSSALQNHLQKKNYVEDECWIFSDFSFRFSRLKLSLFGLWYGSVVELKIIGDYVGWGVTCWIVFEWGELWTYWVIVAKIFINLVIFCKNSKTLASTFVTFQVFKQSIKKMMNSPWSKRI